MTSKDRLRRFVQATTDGREGGLAAGWSPRDPSESCWPHSLSLAMATVRLPPKTSGNTSIRCRSPSLILSGPFLETPSCSDGTIWCRSPRGERGLKVLCHSAPSAPQGVAPHAGSWIERSGRSRLRVATRCRSPRGERGLKHEAAGQGPGSLRRSPLSERGLKHHQLCGSGFADESLSASERGLQLNRVCRGSKVAVKAAGDRTITRALSSLNHIRILTRRPKNCLEQRLNPWAVGVFPKCSSTCPSLRRSAVVVLPVRR
jgi:hypothetical protein